MKLYTEKELDYYAVDFKTEFKPELPKGIELPDEEEIEKTAKKYAIEHSNAPDKDTPDWIMADFKAGVNFILNIIKEQAK